MRDRAHPHLHVTRALAHLHQVNVQTLVNEGAWSVARVLHHLAQSIAFSIDGYPHLKSDVFRHTIGPLALSVFEARGKMMHGLDEPIPGETIDPSIEVEVARDRLVAELTRFDAHAGPLQPHFAYGELDKSHYARAHVMHIQNHWLAMSVKDD
ncbi:MAG: DUF1569 domain-containing protein [Pseudomonadota bacterium]